VRRRSAALATVAARGGGTCLLQFADLNLGECGVMYVFAETQFWQCR